MVNRGPDNERIFTFIMYFTSPKSMHCNFKKSYHPDNSYKLPNIEFGEEIIQVESIEVTVLNISKLKN